MRAWWWTLITAHLVWGIPERVKDDYGNTVDLQTNQNSAKEDKIHSSPIMNSKNFYTRIRRSSEIDEREKKQLGFHSWGGKRYRDEDEEEVGNNIDAEENIVFHEPRDGDLMTDVSLHLASNGSNLEYDGLEDRLIGEFEKRIKPSPAFSSWGGKRDPEMMNDVSKRHFFSPILQQNWHESKLEQSRKRYPSFSSWAGKRAAASSSWGGKNNGNTESRDDFKVNEDFSKTADTENQIDSDKEYIQIYQNPNSGSSDYEENSILQDTDPGINNFAELSSRTTPQDKEHYSPEERHFLLQLDSQTLQRPAAFKRGIGKNSIEESNEIVFKKVQNSSNVKHASNDWTKKRAAAFDSWAGKRVEAFNSWAGKRAAAFNSWGGKRAAAFNSWGGKRAPAFNSWAGKRAAAFNSWGGKRGPAFNSWAGKRAAAFNSWAGKREEAFNSWGGKRAADFNSGERKRPTSFNSWGGKRPAAFNSWGGKRAADFGSSVEKKETAFGPWGRKRAAAFNSWGGKRDLDIWNERPKLEYPSWTTDKVLYDIHFPDVKSHEKNFERTNRLLNLIDKANTNQLYVSKHASDINFDKMKEQILKNNLYLLFNDKQLRNTEAERLINHEKESNEKSSESLYSLKKRTPPSLPSLAGKRNPLFSSWYGSKIPTVLLTNGKRRPAFSSWGGKRSEQTAVPQLVDCSPDNTVSEDTTLQIPEEALTGESSPLEVKSFTRKKREVQCSGEKTTSALTIERDKRASGNLLKNRVFTRMMLQGGWPMAFQSMSHGKNFFAWGGKRSLDKGLRTLR